MENQEYLKTLKSQLRSMDRVSRQNILNEIRASVDDAPDARLVDRFGSVYQLSAKYLEDMPTRATWRQRIGSGVKWLLLGLGGLFLLIILIMWLVFRSFTNAEDSFDYRNISATEIDSLNWIELEGSPDDVEVFQSSVVVYTGDYAGVSYACEVDEDDDEYERDEFVDVDEATNTLKISQSKCFLRLPNDVDTIDAGQSSIVVTDLESNLNIHLWQAQLRLALNAPVELVNGTQKCEFAAEQNLEGGVHTLNLTGKWCAVEDYEFED